MILLTRPHEDSHLMAQELAKHGVDSFIAPLFEIEFIPQAFEPNNFDAFIFTSKNAVRVYCQHYDIRDKAVFAVGAATAELAKQLGFKQITTANGTVDELIKTITRSVTDYKLKLIHIAGEEVTGDLAQELLTSDLICKEIMLYRKHYVRNLHQETIAKISKNAFHGIVFLSPNTASAFNQLIEKHELCDSIKLCTAFCISKNTADKLIAKWWENIAVAKEPNQKALITSIIESYNNHI